ncbi:Isonitrile hydratase [Paramyrothecium foliicola]|nr:Isonitrile hydratase [Paramyrothecium foliicola]
MVNASGKFRQSLVTFKGPCLTENTAPLKVGMVLFPGFTALDVFGPLNVFNTLSIKNHMTLSMLSYDMNPVSVERHIVGEESYGNTGNGASPFFTQYVLPTHTFDDAPDLDVIIVPGGSGTRNMTSTQPAVDWLTQRLGNSDCEWPDYMMTVCTGTALLARTGKIGGRNATTNKAAFGWVKNQTGAADVNWVAKARWVVDGKLWTSSGVSAGVDMTLAWVEHEYGKNVSDHSKLMMEWNHLEQEDDPFAEKWGLA